MLKRILYFDENNFFIEEKIEEIEEGQQLAPNQYFAEPDEQIAFYRPKLENGVLVEGKTEEEIKADAELPPGDLPEWEQIRQENELLKAQNNALSERADFMEELIAEMAMLVYP